MKGKGQKLGEEELRELLAENYSWVTRFCVYELGDSASGLDCGQEVMLQVATSINSFDGRSEFKTWLFVIVKRTIAKFLVKERKRKERFETGVEDDAARAVSSDAELVDQVFEKKQAEAALIEKIRLLAEKQRHAVLLHYFEDLDVKEVSNRMNCSESSVKTHLRRARAKLAEVLGNEKEQILTRERNAL